VSEPPYTGKLGNWKGEAKGYGFLIRDNDHRQIFVHASKLKAARGLRLWGV
jgi:cold shock CspA family protein